MMSPKSVTRIVNSAYGINCKQVLPIDTATKTVVYKVLLNDDRWFILKCFPKYYGISGMTSESEYISFLQRKILGVPLLHQTKSSKFFGFDNVENIFFYLMEYISGKKSDRCYNGKSYLGAKIELLMAMYMAQKDDLFRIRRDSEWPWYEQEKYLRKSQIPASLFEHVSSNRFIRNPFGDNCPVIHNDSNSSNFILNEQNTLYIIDFTNSINGPIEWEISLLIANHLIEGENFSWCISYLANEIRSIDSDWVHTLLKPALSQLITFRGMHQALPSEKLILIYKSL